jgi:hypothetical protein
VCITASPVDAFSINWMKIPESRAAIERFVLRRDPADHRRDPYVPDELGIVHGFPADSLVFASQGAWIAKRKTAFAQRNRSWVAFCAANIRVILPQSFDTAEPAACAKCVELATLWAGTPEGTR